MYTARFDEPAEGGSQLRLAKQMQQQHVMTQQLGDWYKDFEVTYRLAALWTRSEENIMSVIGEVVEILFDSHE